MPTKTPADGARSCVPPDGPAKLWRNSDTFTSEIALQATDSLIQQRILLAEAEPDVIAHGRLREEGADGDGGNPRRFRQMQAEGHVVTIESDGRDVRQQEIAPAAMEHRQPRV